MVFASRRDLCDGFGVHRSLLWDKERATERKKLGNERVLSFSARVGWATAN